MSATHEVVLNPGEFYFGGGYTRIRTLLGSCVSITLWHPHKHIGGMCHIMLPSRVRRSDSSFDGRYADEAMRLFDREISQRGTRAADYVAKVFGGGNMFPERNRDSASHIGEQNIETALKQLRERRITIAAQHLGGDGHRKLIFDLWNGNAWLAYRNADNHKLYGTAP